MDLKKVYEKLKTWFFEAETKTKAHDGEIYFLLIGINDYLKEDRLNFCIEDSDYILNLWKRRSNIQVKHKNIYQLYDSTATKINIVNRLESLSKQIQSNDQLIIHFAGRSFDEHESHFFIPFDGNEDNMFSCISHSTINYYIHNIQSSNILLIVNTWNQGSNPEGNNRGLLQSSSKERVDNIQVNDLTLYDELMSFLKVKTYRHNKEIFLFTRKPIDKSAHTNVVLGEWKISDDKLRESLNVTRKKVEQLIRNESFEEAFRLLLLIVDNNDMRLDSHVKTLQYKLNEAKEEFDDAKTRKVSTEEFTNLSRSIVNQIDDNGFYLINRPNDKGEKEKERKRKIILFTSADPSDRNALRLNDEFRNIEFELLRSKHRDDYELVPCFATRIADFQRKLLDVKPEIVHFSGHGEVEGVCFVADDIGNTEIVENEPLAKFFQLFSKHIHCIFLNSCHSIHQSEMIKQHIDHIICMNNTVDDKTAIHFASSFYAALASGEDIPFSFDFAINSIDLHKLNGSEIPQLLVRART
ncbi:MAG: caspase family protein [Flavipsychrobacter sp.]|nr:caspase family protein [Flavipsychrobacter sp.]